jgi:uncharacterized protein YccT (UPF0319 family)
MDREPVALLAAVAVVVVSVASFFGVVLETSTVETLLVDGVIVVTALLQRARVTPAPLP